MIELARGQPSAVGAEHQLGAPVGLQGGEPARNVTEQPRFNLAWGVRGDGDLVLRGGAGFSYSRVQENCQYFAGTMPPNVYNTAACFYDVP